MCKKVVNKIKFLLVICLCSFAFFQCVYAADKAAVSQSNNDPREVQTRIYSNMSPNKIIKSALNVLQDESFFIESIDSKAGIIIAGREYDTRDEYINIKQEFGCSKLMTGIKRYSISRTEVNVNVSSAGKNSTVIRTTFRKKILNMYDVGIRVRDITDQAFYSKFYSDLGKELEKPVELL